MHVQWRIKSSNFIRYISHLKVKLESRMESDFMNRENVQLCLVMIRIIELNIYHLWMVCVCVYVKDVSEKYALKGLHIAK